VTSLEYHWFYTEVVRFRVTFLWTQTEELKKRGYKILKIFLLINELPYKVYFARIRCLRLLNIEYPE